MSAPAQSQPSSLLTSPARLRKIDLLRDKNIGTYLPLPQLVAVGDQSSGKSSLLESLTGLPFPRGQELCTRYATQITHRREPESYIHISITPGPGASPNEKATLEKYHKSVSSTHELQDRLPAILAEVNELMDIRTSENLTGTKTFTEDVLKIEKCGPDEDYLTVIDVPGIFRITTDNVTTEADKIMVRNMVQKYICNSHTIILAVLPCNVDIVTQEILALAEQFDPTGQRTLGILTKPDLVRERSAQKVICNLVRGEKKPLQLGYHVVRSRGGDDYGNTFGDRDRDVMFKDSPWNTLPSDRLGVVALRQRLQYLLGELTDRAYPKLRSETRQILHQAQEDLSKLGQSRQTAREQQQFLVSVASDFQHLVRAALNANYSSCSLFDDEKFRLITNVMNAADEFKSDFVKNGHTYEFTQRGEKADNTTQKSIAYKESQLDSFPELGNTLVNELRTEPPIEGVLDWIQRTHHRSRGNELVSYNSTLFSTALREQTSKWMPRVEYFVSRVIHMIHQFLIDSLEATCPDRKVREELLSQILDATLAKYESGLRKARYLVEMEREGDPYTFNDTFGSTLRDKDSGKHMIEEVHDLIKSYYEIAPDRFIDNVYLQSIAASLISEKDGPLGIFTDHWVLSLEPETLDAIAGESFHTREQRQILTKRVQDLTAAIAILR
ncbi:hypothetical protein NLG97_g696 [Lecanicillium saksenae]|uniref:Uncharacterized protein n=1 Tax=Lecanicillium saksenae TaxID=468837 RepID=A0ACC1R628_9HYPO|nr:hypothetical protein NLG97_g696 [Lecanicillium saksenae]